jgi:PAS domain S-box-containing protein
MDGIAVAELDGEGELIRFNENFRNLFNLGHKNHFNLLTRNLGGAGVRKELCRWDGTLFRGMAVSHHLDEKRRLVFFLSLEDLEGAHHVLSAANANLEALLETTCQRLAVEEESMENLKQSKVFLDSIIENIPNMIFVKEAKSLRFLRLNRAGEKLTGFKTEDILGKTDYDLFPEEQAEFFTAKDREVLNGSAFLDIQEESLQTPQGIRYLHTMKIPVLGATGEPEYLLGISEDITEKKEMEFHRMELLRAQASRDEAEKTSRRLGHLAEAGEALNESLNIQTMLSSFAQLLAKKMYEICVIDLEDKVSGVVERVVATSSTEKVLSLKTSRDELNLNDQTDDGLGYVLSNGVAKRYEAASGFEIQKMLRCPEIAQETSGWSAGVLNIVPLTYHGYVFGTLSVISKEDQEDLLALDFNFAQDLARRASLALQNARLFYRAIEASRAKSSFLANISHEVRTPLGAILGFAELALETPHLPEATQKYIATIVKNGDQLLHIVDEILDLSKVESDKIKIEKVSFSPLKLVEDVMGLFKMKAEAKRIGIESEIIGEIPDLVRADPMRIRQILINLIGNAVKFTEQGSVRMKVSFKNEKLYFDILDSGVGISKAQAQRLFQPFVQAEESTSRIFGGTGLGLFLSRKLSHLMGGEVSLVQSSPKKGSHFRVEIKVEVLSPQEALALGVSPENPSGDLSFLESSPDLLKNILVVDDSPDNRALIKGFLDDRHLLIDTAGDGVQGVESALHKDYDMVLMDIQMPEMDGFEAVRTLREKGYKGKVVALTAHAMKGDRERCLQSGFDDYLCKPISRQSLSRCLSRNIHH